jgi:hypothetical protein
MAFSGNSGIPNSLYGTFDGQGTGNGTNTAFNICNSTNPNIQPGNDLFQILAPGGACLLRVNSAGTVTTNVAAGTCTNATVVAAVQMTAAQYAGLANPTGSTASQICQATFPLNFGAQQFDLFQVGTYSPTSNVAGGGGVIFRLDYTGTARTT